VAIYQVKSGDTLSSIAKSHGISSWQKLYDDPSNGPFRAKRPNPNFIVPGDLIFVPDTDSAKGTLNSNPEVANYRMAVIDGTGPGDDNEYRSSMSHSFCRQLGDSLESNKIGVYSRGPSWHGRETKQYAQEAFQYLAKIHAAQPQLRLMLAGYSRGGSAAIRAAELLEKKNIAVDSLFLFDSVARYVGEGGEIIPGNVLFSRHARRDLKAALVLKYEGTISDLELKGFSLINGSNPMRPSFGNSGLKWLGEGDHQFAEPFPGSHGALGGVGWSFVVEDADCQTRVANWMNRWLKKRNVWNELKSFAPPPSTAKNPGMTELVTGWAMDLLMMKRHDKNLSEAGGKQ